MMGNGQERVCSLESPQSSGSGRHTTLDTASVTRLHQEIISMLQANKIILSNT